MVQLLWLRDAAWLFVAAPLVLAASVWVSVRLRGGHLRHIAQGVKALRAPGTDGGEVPAAVALSLSTVGAFGAAAAVGAATAVSLGGAGVVAWVWLFALLFTALRFAETVLSRTAAAGQADGAAVGALSLRLGTESGGLGRLAPLLLGLVIVAGFAFVGGVHGRAASDLAAGLLSGSVSSFEFGVAVVAAGVAVLGMRRGGVAAGWLGLAALVITVAVALWACALEPYRALSTLLRGFSEAFGGAPAATPFVGASAAQVAVAAILGLLPPLAATSGLVGAWHGAARGSTRGQASLAAWGPFVYAAVTTVLAMAIVSTGAYYQPTEDTRRLSEVTVYRGAADTQANRQDPTRLYPGYIRVIDGEMRDRGITLATERGVVRSPRFFEDGEPADFAVHYAAGKPLRLLRPGEVGLSEHDLSEVSQIEVRGRMLPRGGRLLARAVGLGTGGELGTRLLLAALLALLAAGAAAWGLGLARCLPPSAPKWAGVLVSLVPALGIGLDATGLAPWLGPLGGLVAAGLASLVAVVLILRAREAG